MKVEDCLDNRNTLFYRSQVETKLNVSIIPNPLEDNIWRARYRNGDQNVFIVAGSNYPNIESFTHEMLHLYLFANGFKVYLAKDISDFEILRVRLLSPSETLDGIANLISHYKMLPIYINELKMEKAKFFADAYQYVTDDNLGDLEKNYSKTDSVRFTNFVRHFFDTRYHFSEIYKEPYSNYTRQLELIDKTLYIILDNHCSEWEKKITSYDNTHFFNSLFNALENYLA